MRWFEDRLSRSISVGNFPLASWSVAPAPITQPAVAGHLFRWWRFSYCKHNCCGFVHLQIHADGKTFFLRKQCDAVALCRKCHIPPVSLHPYESSNISSAANPVVLMDPPPISTCPENPAWKSSSVSTNKREAFPLVSYQGIDRQPVESTVSNLPAKDKGCHKEVISSSA